VALVLAWLGAACGPAEPWPAGSLDALPTLRERDDLSVLFVLIDTLRADHLGAYGHARPTSPALDALARGGIRFAAVQSQSSWTKPSMASLWTGLHPARTGVLRLADALPEHATLAAEVFRAAGFRTAGIWRNPWMADAFGFDQGFDFYLRPAPGPTPPWLHRRGTNPLLGSDQDVTEAALAFLEDAHAERFLLYVHYMDVHQYVYDDASARFGNERVDRYDNAILWTDRNVARLLAALEALDLRRRTLVVVASDHGEAFGEHGFEGHGRDLHRELVETPLLISLPFRLEPGVVVHERVENVDLWPTLLELLGLPPLPQADGRSLLGLVRDATPDARAEEENGRSAFALIDRTWASPDLPPERVASVTRGPLRLIRSETDPAGDRLYDRREGEQRNLAAERPESLQALRAELSRHLARPPAWEEVPQAGLDALPAEQLRALGYLVP
jgi:arylsulfatase A-like enzyme